jgi:hypothetical protein
MLLERELVTAPLSDETALVTKGSNPAAIRISSARLSVLRPIACSVSNVSRIGRRRRRGLSSGGFQCAQIFLQHLDLVLRPLPSSGPIALGRRRCTEGYVAMSLEEPGVAHPHGHVVVLAVVRISARVQRKSSNEISSARTRRAAICTGQITCSCPALPRRLARPS